MSNYSFVFDDITDALPALLRTLDRADVVTSRAGRTKEITQLAIGLREPWNREVLVPGRRCNIAAQIAETAWVLAGRDDVEWLAHYLPRARDFSDNGKTWRGAYGRRLRKWGQLETDQLAHVVETLKADPGSRQAVAVLYNPVIDNQPGKDIPCNNWLSFLIRDGRLDLHVAVRSNDVMWGWSGINVFEWSTVLEIVAALVGVGMGQLHFSVTSFHIYERHWDRAQRIVQEDERTERVTVTPSPRFAPRSQQNDIGTFDALLEYWFQIEYDIRTGSPLAWGYIDSFPEPMLRSWLIVLDWWWNGQHNGSTLDSIKGTALEAVCHMGLRPPWQTDRAPSSAEHQTVQPSPTDGLLDALTGRNPQPMSAFLDYACRLHNEKHAAYGDSWKRRGEMLGIMANIARKIDRLGAGETTDETQADTALDTMVYLGKYRVWLGAQHVDNCSVDPTATTDATNALLVEVEHYWGGDNYPSNTDPAWLEARLRDAFTLLEKEVMSHGDKREQLVTGMLQDAYLLARIRYDAVEHAGDAYLGADHD